MKTPPDIRPIMIPLKYAFKKGQQDILEKITIIAQPWISGKETDEDFARKLNEFFNEYGK